MSSSDSEQPVRRMLLIGSEALLDAWRAHVGTASDVITVGHNDLARVLAVLAETQPEVVVVEQSLAGTSRGIRLMEQLHNERSARGLEVSLLPGSGVDAVMSAAPGTQHPQHWLTGMAQPLPPRRLRGAVRVRGGGAEQVSIDGRAGVLIDVSVTGAQVQSSGSLRPNQHVRVALSKERGAARTEGIVVWSSLKAGPPPHYRVGIAFKKELPDAIGQTPDPEVVPEPSPPPQPPPTKPRRAKPAGTRKPKG